MDAFLNVNTFPESPKHISSRLSVLEEAVLQISETLSSGVPVIRGVSSIHSSSEVDVGRPDNWSLAENRKKSNSDKTCSSNSIHITINDDLVDKYTSIQTHLADELNALDLPGLRFITESGQNWSHRFLWILIQISAIFASYVYIKDAYDIWQSSPIVQTLSNKLINMKEIPFPAVTLCFPNSINADYNMSGKLEECTICDKTSGNTTCLINPDCDVVDIYTLMFANDMCYMNNREEEEPHSKLLLTLYMEKDVSINGSLDSYMEKLLPSCEFLPEFTIILDPEEMLLDKCNLGQLQWLLSNRFQKQLCATYNALSHEDIYKQSVVLQLPFNKKSLTKGQKPVLHRDFKRNMEFEVGNKITTNEINKILFIVDSENDTYKDMLKLCNLNPDYVSVVVHDPRETPVINYYNQRDHSLAKNVEYNVLVTPKLIIAKSDIADYNPIQRGCYFSHENWLSMFKFYSKSNCELECLVNCSIQTCGCVAQYLPRPNTSVEVCLLHRCEPICDCSCLPDCNSLSYDVEIEEITMKPGEEQGSMVLVFQFSGKEFYPTIRYSINNLSEFVAYSLGMLGVFNGFSVMVLWELLYLLTMRLWFFVKISLQRGDFQYE